MTQWGMNTNNGSPTGQQYYLNAFNANIFWQLSTTLTGGGATNGEQQLNLDTFGNPISLSTGWDGSSLGAGIYANVYLYQFIDYRPTGAGTWTLQFKGRGTFTFSRDAISNSPVVNATSGVTVTQALNITQSDAIGVSLSGTGFSTTATFSGTTVTMTGSNFTAGTPVTFLNSGGVLPTRSDTGSALTSMNVDGTATILYVLAGGLTANTFQLGVSVGGSAISFSGGSGTHTGYGDWAREIAVVPTTYLTRYNAGEIWNPAYVAKFAGVGGMRFMQMQRTYMEYITTPVITLTSGAPGTVNWTGHNFRPGQSVSFQSANDGGISSLPAALSAVTTYYVLLAGYATNSFQVSATQGGAPIAFATGGIGTLYGIGKVALSSKNITPAGYLFTGPNIYNNNLGGTSAFGGPSPEAMADLCFRLGGASGCAVWLNFPPLSDTSWATVVAQRIYAKRAALGASFKVYTEHGNETMFANSAPDIGYLGRAHALFSAVANDNDGQFLYGLYAGCQNGEAFRTAWTGAGGTALDHVRVFAGQAGFPSYMESLLPRLATESGGNASYWTGKAVTHFDAYATAPYFNVGEEMPVAWSADSDGGVAKAYQEYRFGGILLLPSSPATTTGGTSSAYTATIAGVTNTNQTLIKVTFHTPTAGSGAVTLSVNGAGAAPLQDRSGNPFANTYGSQSGTWYFCYTSSVGNYDSGAHNWLGAVAPGSGTGWRVVPYTGNPNGGQVQNGLDWTAADFSRMNTFNSNNGSSLYLIGYEGGQTWSDFGHGDGVYTNYGWFFNRSNEMGLLYTYYMNAMSAAGQNNLFCHYADSGASGNQGNFFGLIDSLLTDTPKYTAYMALVNGGTPPPPPPTTAPLPGQTIIVSPSKHRGRKW